MTSPIQFSDINACVDALVERLSGRICLALPLGLGKPVRLANALYRQACSHPEIELTIYTALSLERPIPQSDLEGRLINPMAERLYQHVPELGYVADVRRNAVPSNVRIVEFYFRPGAYLGNAMAQQNYTSMNYTNAARDLMDHHINVIAQMVAPATGHSAGRLYSLSCNPDITCELLDLARSRGTTLPLLIGEVNPALPFMPGDAEMAADEFDILIENDDTHYQLFPVPNRAVSLADQAIGLRVAALIRDGGTLQIGIGSLGDAVAYAIGLRRSDNEHFRSLITCLGTSEATHHLDDLPEGLHGVSEMLVEGFLHLFNLGIMRPRDDSGVFLHAGFFLGSAGFYTQLRQLSDQARKGINMTRISFTNKLLGDEETKRQQRRHARFVNTAMMVTLMGATVSDGLEDGRVVSGVGGQHDFVTMGHELKDARSIIVLPATRTAKGRITSNIVWNYGHETIPRHLRDMVVTEYGVADLRGATDQEVIARLLNIADSRFQESLRRRAVAAGKLPEDYRIAERYRSNTSDALALSLQRSQLLHLLPLYPLGTDLTHEEAEVAVALTAIGQQQGSKQALLSDLLAGWRQRMDPRLKAAFQRLDLSAPRSLKERIYQAMLASALIREVHAGGRPLFPRNISG